MLVDVVLLPRDLTPDHLRDRSCVVFDVLRATTTMTAALAAGVAEVRLFESLDAARAAAEHANGNRVLCGERACLPPEGFDLGNSPGQFGAVHRGATLFMCTTNGTRALLAARAAAATFAGALVNAAAVARVLAAEGRDVTLLCAGTDGQVAMEDFLGAGAVLDALGPAAVPGSDVAGSALVSFQAARDDLGTLLRETEGGRNVIDAGLEADIDFAARLSVLDVVGIAAGDPLAVRAWDSGSAPP